MRSTSSVLWFSRRGGREGDWSYRNPAGSESFKRWEGGKRWRDGGRLPSLCLTQQTSGLLLLLLLCLDSPTLFSVLLSRGGGQRRGRQRSTGVAKGGWEKGRKCEDESEKLPEGFKKLERATFLFQEKVTQDKTGQVVDVGRNVTRLSMFVITYGVGKYFHYSKY